MRRIGLPPSSTGAPGGAETGYKVSHYVIDGGPFDLSYKVFDASNPPVRWGDAFTQRGEAWKPKRETFVCPRCDQKVLGIPKTRVKCGWCDLVMAARHKGETTDSDAGASSDSIGAGELR
jgi:ribosomal protein S27AE